jgi:hypothetical protein
MREIGLMYRKRERVSNYAALARPWVGWRYTSNMNNKHQAVIAVAILILVFIGLIAWFHYGKQVYRAPVPDGTATTTPNGDIVVEPLHIREETRFYEIDMAYPPSTPLRASAGADADARAVAAMKGFAQNTLEAFKENNELANMTEAKFAEITFNRDAKYAMTTEYKLYTSPKTISYVFSIYQDTMGAHPNTYYRSFTFDRDTGHALHLGELFVPGAPYLERLSKRTRTDPSSWANSLKCRQRT